MKYPQIRAGQVWHDSGTGDDLRVDEVYASDPFRNGKWRAMVRYTVTDGRDPDVTEAEEFWGWITKYDMTLVEAQQVAA